MATKKKNTKKSAKENERMRKERISGSDNGRTMRTRVVKDKKKYTRKTKHKKNEKSADDMMEDFGRSLKKLGINIFYRDTWIEKRTRGLTARDKKMLEDC